MTREDAGDLDGLRPVFTADDVLEPYRGTPVEALILAQNLGQHFEAPGTIDFAVATCIDPRVRLALPEGCAYLVRSAGVNVKNEGSFLFGYMSLMMGIRHIALIAHEDCAMTRLKGTRSEFVTRLAEKSGADADSVGSFFDSHSEYWHVDDEIETVRRHAAEIQARVGDEVVVAPLYYSLDNRLAQVI